jgi:hypothetical protein
MKEFLGESLVGQPISPPQILLKGIWRKEITRANPAGGYFPPSEVEEGNLVVTTGMDYLADRIGSRAIGANSTMTHCAIGTSTTVATINQTTLPGEVLRRLFDSTSRAGNIWITVNTFGGGSDGITSVVIAEAGVFNASGSGTGVMMQRAALSTVVLANSDFLKLQVETTVGSR